MAGIVVFILLIVLGLSLLHHVLTRWNRNACPHCSGYLPDDVASCPYCRADASPSVYSGFAWSERNFTGRAQRNENAVRLFNHLSFAYFLSAGVALLLSVLLGVWERSLPSPGGLREVLGFLFEVMVVVLAVSSVVIIPAVLLLALLWRCRDVLRMTGVLLCWIGLRYAFTSILEAPRAAGETLDAIVSGIFIASSLRWFFEAGLPSGTSEGPRT